MIVSVFLSFVFCFILLLIIFVLQKYCLHRFRDIKDETGEVQLRAIIPTPKIEAIDVSFKTSRFVQVVQERLGFAPGISNNLIL